MTTGLFRANATAGFRHRRWIALTMAAALVFGLGACDPNRKADNPLDKPKENQASGSLFGEGGLLFGDDKKKDEGGGVIGVNSFLWRASLDTVSFMPVTSADAFGGVIITDWHSPPETPNERFKLNVYILGRSLRADGIRVSVFRQARGRNGEWQDSRVPDQAATDVENAILTRARQLRQESLNQ